MACERQDYAAANYLLFRGAKAKNVWMDKGGRYREFEGQIMRRIIPTLCLLGVDVLFKTVDGLSVTQIFASMDDFDTVKIFLDLGAVHNECNDLLYDKKIVKLFEDYKAKSDKERQELKNAVLAEERKRIANEWFVFARPQIVDICLAMSALGLSHYVLLWIIDWLPRYDMLSHIRKIRLIESIARSIRKIKNS